MISRLISLLTHPRRISCDSVETADDIEAFIDSRTLEYPTRLEDDFVRRAVNLGVEGGMVLDVGTRVGLIALKILWQNESFYSIGMDTSGSMIERARQTAEAWGLDDRAFFQVGDARRMRFKTGYFDLIVSDSSLHRFDDSLAVFEEIRRVLKPKGALLIRDFRRPARLHMKTEIADAVSRFGAGMRPQLEAALQAAYTPSDLYWFAKTAGLQDFRVVEPDRSLVMIERRGQTDPNSWIKAREQYL